MNQTIVSQTNPWVVPFLMLAGNADLPVSELSWGPRGLLVRGLYIGYRLLQFSADVAITIGLLPKSCRRWLNIVLQPYAAPTTRVDAHFHSLICHPRYQYCDTLPTSHVSRSGSGVRELLIPGTPDITTNTG